MQVEYQRDEVFRSNDRTRRDKYGGRESVRYAGLANFKKS